MRQWVVPRPAAPVRRRVGRADGSRGGRLPARVRRRRQRAGGCGLEPAAAGSGSGWRLWSHGRSSGPVASAWAPRPVFVRRWRAPPRAPLREPPARPARSAPRTARARAGSAGRRRRALGVDGGKTRAARVRRAVVGGVVGRERGGETRADQLDGLVEDDAEVPAAFLELVEEGDAGGGVARGEGVDERIDRLGVGQPEQVADAGFVDWPPDAASSWSSIDSASRIPPAASRAIEVDRRRARPRPSAARIRRSLPSISGTVSRRTSNRWRRDRIAGGKPDGSVEANMKTTKSGGSSSDLRSAFQASFVIWCASSRM